MSEIPAEYIIENKKVNPEIYAAAQRLQTFCQQFEKMSEEERKVCLDRADQLCPGKLVQLINYMSEWMAK